MDYRQFPSYMNPYQPYQDQLSQLRSNQYQMPQQNTCAINWVQGEAGAKAWIVNPGASVLLMDSEAQRFYIKSTDQTGMPTMRVFEYKEVNNTAPAEQMPPNGFVTRDEFEDLKSRMERLSESVQKAVTEPRRTRQKEALTDESAV